MASDLFKRRRHVQSGERVADERLLRVILCGDEDARTLDHVAVKSVTSPKPPSRNHYIPEFLLRRWTGEDGRFTRFLRVGESKLDKKRATPSEIGFARDIYTMTGQERKNAYQIEEGLLRHIDDSAGKIVTRLLVGDRPRTLRERSDWARFLMRLVHMKPYDLDTKIASYELLFPHMFPELGKLDPMEARNLVLRHAWTSLNSKVGGRDRAGSLSRDWRDPAPPNSRRRV